MSNADTNAIQAALSPEVKQAVRRFAEMLAATPEFKAFEQAAMALNEDEAAGQAQSAFAAKQQSLQALLQLNAVSPEDRAVLEQLRQAFLSLPSVAAYARAEAGLVAMCQQAGDVLSRSVGIDFAGVCASGCC